MSINTFVAIGIAQIRKAVDCAIFPSWESYFYFFFYSLHLFKVEPKPRYVNRTHGMLAGSVAFLPSFVQHHDMAHLNPQLFMPFVRTQPRHVLSHSKSCLLPLRFTISLLGNSAVRHVFNKILVFYSLQDEKEQNKCIIQNIFPTLWHNIVFPNISPCVTMRNK